VYSVGKSIADYLDQNYPAELKNAFKCAFRPVSSAEIAGEDAQNLDQLVSVFLHRITRNEQLRSPSRIVGRPDQQPTLFLDLHYLVTYWGTSVEAEHTILGWVMQQLEENPVLDASILSKNAGWEATDTVQLVPANLNLEDILRIWDALGPKYRLSVAYLSDRQGEAVLAVPGIGQSTNISDEGDVLTATVAATVTAYVDPANFARRNTWLPDPDDVLNDLANPVLKTLTQAVKIGRGGVEVDCRVLHPRRRLREDRQSHRQGLPVRGREPRQDPDVLRFRLRLDGGGDRGTYRGRGQQDSHRTQDGRGAGARLPGQAAGARHHHRQRPQDHPCAPASNRQRD